MTPLSNSRRRFGQFGFLAAACLVLASSCSMLPGPSAAQAVANACTTGASRINPAALLPGGAESTAVSPGVGGTGQLALRPGIGGTGSPQSIAKGGIGGTGIVGVVTGFASICVNDVEVHYNPSTPVVIDGQAATVGELEIGQLVVVRASGAAGQANAQLQAKRIAVLHLAIGPLDSVDTATGKFSVMGQSAVALHKEQLASLHARDWVSVSGFRLSDGFIRASQVQVLAEPLPAARVLGPVIAIDRNTAQVGRTTVQFKTLPAGLAVGQEIAVSGRWKIDRLEASTSVLQPTLASLGPVTEVLLQGHVHALSGREVTLGYGLLRLGEPARVTAGTMEGLAINQRVLIHGHLDSSRQVVVDQLEFMSDRETSGEKGIFGQVEAGQGTGKAGASRAGSSADHSGNGGATANGSGASGR